MRVVQSEVEQVKASGVGQGSGSVRIRWWQLIKDAATDWSEDKAPRLGAALAYYTVFSLAPLLIIAISVAGWFFGKEAVQSQLDEQLQGFLGNEGAAAVQEMVAGGAKPATSLVAAVIGTATLLIGAAGVFVQLKDAMNTIWEVEPKPGRGIWGMIRDRLFSFAMVLSFSFLLLVTLLVSAVVSAATNSIHDLLPGPDAVAHLVDLAFSLLVVIVIFALIFKYVPDAQIAWRDVWLGAVVTGFLFTAGKYAFGAYLGTLAVGSAYGAAGSLVIVLLWVYYSAQILFFGAELTQAYARHYGSRIVPVDEFSQSRQ